MQSKTTISVSEMRKMLGLKKTESYWLLKKEYFEVVTINNQLRIVLSSFEDWYENQVHYRKVDGPEPGRKLKEKTYTVFEIAEIFGISEDSVIEMIHRHNLPHFTIGQHWRIEKEAFEAWYSSQTHYRKKDQRDKDKPLIDASVTITQFGRMLGLTARESYTLVRKLKPVLEIIIVGDHKRITRTSIDRWYSSQDKYRYTIDRRNRIVSADMVLQAIPTPTVLPKKTISISEAAKRLGIDSSLIYREVESGRLPAKLIGKHRRLKISDLVEWASSTGIEIKTEDI